MTPDGDAAYQILLAHDARYDGRLFVGVTSTGIYCRPICRVRMPARRNCRFFSTPAQAEAAAFRPCLKCRPEIAPGPGLPWTVMDASRTLARQAAAGLDAAAASGEATSVAGLARRLGVSDRHLRRIFFAEHGVTPVQYQQTRRLLLAKQLLTDTRMPIVEVALSSGFRSLRRFNAAFAESYRMNPSRLRRSAVPGSVQARSGNGNAVEGVGTAPPIVVDLGYRPPHDEAALLSFIAKRSIPGIESVAGLAIRRSVRSGLFAAEPGWLEARFVPQTARLQLAFAPCFGPASGSLIAAVRRWLDLDASPDTIDAALAGLPGGPGLRLPGSIDAFELAVRAVLGQQVTVAAARTLAHRLADRFGTRIESPWPEIVTAFPPPALLAAAPLADIASLGIIRSRAGAIQAVAEAWADIEALTRPGSAPEALVARLCEVPGIGPWTAHYIAMRTLGWPDAFPPGDVAALKAMRTLYASTSQREADRQAEAWRPWRAYALLRLWNSLDKPPPATSATP